MLGAALVGAAAAAVVVFSAGAATLSAGVVRLGDTSFTVGLRLDRVSVLLVALVAGVGALVASFADRYLDRARGAGRFRVLLVATAAALGLTAAGASLPVIAVGWTAAGLGLAGLIGTAGDAAGGAARSVRRRLLVGDAFVWAGVVAAAVVLADLDRTALGAGAASASAGGLAVVAVLLAIGGSARSALVPFHRWLPETTAAPTPVSAQLHAGLVNGLGLLGLLAWPVFAESPAGLGVLLGLGTLTAVVGMAQMRARADVKGRLVASTSAQMGYMGVQLGLGAPGAALFHLIGHGLFKATLFLGSGSAVVASPDGPAHAPGPPRRPGRVAAEAAAALVAVGAVLAAVWATGIVPYEGPPAIVLFAAAGLTGVVALLALAGRGLRSGQVAGLSAGVLGALAAYLVGAGVVDRAVHEVLLPDVTWSAAGGALATTVVLVSGVAGLLADSAVRRGRLPRLYAWAARSGLPPRLGRPRVVGVVEAAAAPPVGSAPRAEVRVAVEEASRVVGPSWPLTDFVASNPLAGLEHLPFAEAAAAAGAARGSNGFQPLPTYRSLRAEGRIADAAIEHALDRKVPSVPDPVVVGGVRCDRRSFERTVLLGGPPDEALLDAARVVLTRPGVDVGAPTVATRGERLDATLGTRIVEAVNAETALWCAIWADAGTAGWPMPGRELGLWAAWRRVAAGPGGDRALGARGFSASVSLLPARADEALVVLLDRLGVASPDRVPYLSRSLGQLPGWASHLAWRAGGRAGETATDDVVDLLAIRLAYEAALVSAAASTGSQHWPATVADPSEAAVRGVAAAAAALGLRPHRVLALDDEAAAALVAAWASFPEPSQADVWQLAYEEDYRAGLLDSIASQATLPGVAVTPERPAAQAVFCIDVRAERLRRHLEDCGPYETLGFAGFFGVPFSYLPLGGDHPTPQCPVLLRPRNQVAEVPAPGAGSAAASALDRRRARVGAAGAGHAAEERPFAAFALAEAAGWPLAVVAAARTVAPSWAVGARRRRQAASCPDTRLALEPVADGHGFTVDERVFLAEAGLLAMGLVRGFARLVLLCGHGASTENNPYATAYACGACGGHDGAPNARALAAILNDPVVRERLRERGIDVPGDTLFVAAVHDTTRDEVAILDATAVPASHRGDLAQLEADLDRATADTAVERWSRLPGAQRPGPLDVARSRALARHRAADWAQVRPEWGLAGNAAFVVGPRHLTRGLDLDGRVFLHSYRVEHDPDGAALEVILTAPLVVAEWINTQYYFSTVDPDRLGAGDKAVHNVVSGFGVLIGPRGDLAAGLPLQSLFDEDGRAVHEPRRLLAVVHAPHQLVLRIIERNPLLQRLVGNGWVALATVDPDTGRVRRCESSDLSIPQLVEVRA